MKRSIVSIYIILMIIAFNCYSPFLTSANIWNGINSNDYYPTDLDRYGIYTLQKIFEEKQLVYNKNSCSHERVAALKTILANSEILNKAIKKPINFQQMKANQHQNDQNKRFLILKIGFNKGKIIVNEDNEEISFFFPVC